MKKLNNCIFNFCVPEKRCCLWVGVAMKTVERKHRKKQNRKSYNYPAAYQETAKTPLLQ